MRGTLLTIAGVCVGLVGLTALVPIVSFIVFLLMGRPGNSLVSIYIAGVIAFFCLNASAQWIRDGYHLIAGTSPPPIDDEHDSADFPDL
jgi:hypothetical protein